MKNTIYVIVIILCIIVAAVIFLLTRSGGPGGGIKDIPRGEEMYWVMCNNQKCGETYQIDKRDYFEQIQEKMQANPLSNKTPPLICQKCKEPSAYKAIKCEKCGKTFFEGASNDFPDRCPSCKYSKTEAIRKERLSQRGQ